MANPDIAPPSDRYDMPSLRAQLGQRRGKLADLARKVVSTQIQDLIEEVDAAIHRLDRGELGACRRCDGWVEPDRLAQDPLTSVCLDCLTVSERRALEHDLQLASKIQAALLPPQDFASHGWSGRYLYRPFGAVSGDYIDVFETSPPDGNHFVMLGDVSGKGVAAAMLMSHLNAALRASASKGANLAEVIANANRLLCGATGASSFATLVAARLDPDGLVELCTAGHTPALLASASGVEHILSDCLPLGLFCDTAYTTRSFRLRSGDGLLFYTDGVTEAVGPDGVELGTRGLAASLATANGHPPTKVIEMVTRVVDNHLHGRPLTDDLTVLFLRRM